MDIASQRRGKKVAVAAMVFQFAIAVAMLIVWLRTDSLSAMAATWFLAAGLPLWLMAIVLFYCRQLQCQEDLELQEIAARADSNTIFEHEGQGNVRVAAARMKWMLKWAVPVFTLAFAIMQVALGLLVVRQLPVSASSLALVPQINLTQSLILCVMACFGGLLISRYSTGMATQETYRPLRAGGNYLLINVLAIIGVLVVMGLAFGGRVSVDRVLAYVLPAVQLVLAAELVMNFLLDVYRPRVPGQEQRLAFDSRLFNLIASPSRVGHSIAETLNYQFGFEVSKTWFYQILSKALTPMLVLGAVILIGMTAVVVVPQGEQAVVLHWGKVSRVIDQPGLALKWPWPVDVVNRFDVQTVRDLYLGVGERRSEQQIRMNFVKGRELNIWTQEHGINEEKDFLLAVARPGQSAQSAAGQPPAVNVIKLVVLMQYKIKDPLKYGYRYDNPDKQLECLAHREMIDYLASATLLEEVSGGERAQAIMTTGRQAASAELRKRIAQAVEDELGVELLYVGLQSVHPPVKAAKAYEEVLEAERRQDEKRFGAEATANRILAQVAGSPSQALELALAIQKERQLESMSLATGQELNKRADGALVWARENLRTLDEELGRDRLLGKLATEGSSQDAAQPVRITDKQRLRMQYVQYIDQLEAIKASPARLPDDLAKASQDAQIRFALASGQPAALEADARAERWQIELAERSKAESFQRELLAYQAAPNIYMLDRWLDVWDEVLPGAVKYVFGVPREKIELRLDLRSDPVPLEGVMESDKDQRN